MIVRTYRGMTPGDYRRIWAEQGEGCGVCGRTGQYAKRHFALEHDHELNWPRGICCAPCNDFLGYIRDNPFVAQRLVEYLENPPAWKIVGPPPKELPME